MTLHFLTDQTDIVAHPSFKHTSSHDAEILGKAPLVVSGSLRRQTLYRRITKRALDIFLSLIATPFVVPMILLMAAVIMLDGHNPFYSQMRVGRRGRIFRMWKLRTMVHDADSRLESYLAANPAARLEWQTTQKLKNDPRITLAGQILRKISLDELPQLWNVLIGDMSLVGPRPMMACQRADYVGHSYYTLRPGITGLWQISDRNDCEFAGRARYDDLYERMISFKTDVWILLRTVGVVIRGTGY